MKEEYLKRIAYSYDEIGSPNTITKMLSIEQIHYNFLNRMILVKLSAKINRIKAKTNKDHFLQTDAINKLEKKVNEALTKVA